MAETSVLIVADDDADLAKVKAQLEESGLKGVTIQENLRQLQGKIAKDAVTELEKIEGVRSVEEERKIQLPPRGSPVQ
jgi:hypothetical protein